jgi:hypothetical protein
MTCITTIRHQITLGLLPSRARGKVNQYFGGPGFGPGAYKLAMRGYIDKLVPIYFI